MLARLFSVVFVLVSTIAWQAPAYAEANARRVDRLLDFPLRKAVPRSFSGLMHFALLHHVTVTKEKSVDETGVMLEHHVFEYSGMKIQALSPCPPCSKVMLEEIEITSSHWPLRNGIKVGSPASRVDEIMGSADESTTALRQFCNDNLSCITFSIAVGQVKSILISYYID